MNPTIAEPRQKEAASRPGVPLRLFADLALRYWFQVFPSARRVQRQLHAHAESIPHQALREDALVSHRQKRTNSEGLAALAVLAPAEHRAHLARSLAAYQLMLDYLDGVSERPGREPLANGLQLHRAFEVALDPGASHADYYRYAESSDDAGYLRALIETCRSPLTSLPSYEVARGPLLRQARLCRESQALNHSLHLPQLDGRIDEWTARVVAETELGGGFEWWELVGAAAASSLSIGALLALAATPGVCEADARTVEAAYFPWASGLNALLDSLVDLNQDPEGGSHLRRYPSPQVAGERLGALGTGARERVAALPNGAAHEVILAAMGALYLARADAWEPGCEGISMAVIDALGPLVRPSLAVHLLRRGGRGSGALLAGTRRSRRRR